MSNFNPTGGFDLIEEVSGYSFLADGKKVFSGSLEETVKVMVRQHNFEPEEVMVAIEEMVNNNADRAHFGSFRKFICAINDPVDNVSGNA